MAPRDAAPLDEAIAGALRSAANIAGRLGRRSAARTLEKGAAAVIRGGRVAGATARAIAAALDKDTPQRFDLDADPDADSDDP